MGKKNTLGLILGNQLFSPKSFKALDAEEFFMSEDYGLCSYSKTHKLRVAYFLTAMRDFKDEFNASKLKLNYFDFKDKNFKKSFSEKIEVFLKKNKHITKLSLFEVEDKFFEKNLIDFSKEKKIEIEFHKSPMFLTSRQEFKNYLGNKKRPFMKTFYEAMRKKHNVLIDEKGDPVGGKWSYDAENRKKLPKDYEFVDPIKFRASKHFEEVKSFVLKEFKAHPGELDELWLPTDRAQAKKWFNSFIKDRLEDFGTYQDSITADSDFVSHSLISPLINVGLLEPKDVCDKIEKAYHKSNLPLNSVEGFIRQVIGWREFIRGIYQNFSEEQDTKNFWSHKNKLKPCWYDGTTGVEVLDDAIKKANRIGYTHHIERLMILSNMMLLCEVDPVNVHEWFMEMHLDSSDWVMGPNVYGMGQFSDGGIFATKPYICGSNYYLKMSRYKKGDWCEAVDGLYWRFIDKHQAFYKKNPRMSVMVKTLEKMDPERKKRIFKKANEFIKKVTC